MCSSFDSPRIIRRRFLARLGMTVVSTAAFAFRHGQRLRQFRNRNMQGLCAGLAGLVLHERRVAW